MGSCNCWPLPHLLVTPVPPQVPKTAPPPKAEPKRIMVSGFHDAEH